MLEYPEEVQLNRIKSFNERGLITKDHVTYLLNLIEEKNQELSELQDLEERFKDKLRHATGRD